MARRNLHILDQEYGGRVFLALLTENKKLSSWELHQRYSLNLGKVKQILNDLGKSNLVIETQRRRGKRAKTKIYEANIDSLVTELEKWANESFTLEERASLKKYFQTIGWGYLFDTAASNPKLAFLSSLKAHLDSLALMELLSRTSKPALKEELEKKKQYYSELLKMEKFVKALPTKTLSKFQFHGYQKEGQFK